MPGDRYPGVTLTATTTAVPAVNLLIRAVAILGDFPGARDRWGGLTPHYLCPVIEPCQLWPVVLTTAPLG